MRTPILYIGALALLSACASKPVMPNSASANDYSAASAVANGIGAPASPTSLDLVTAKTPSSTLTPTPFTSWSLPMEKRMREAERKFAMSAFIDGRYEYLETLADLYNRERHYTPSGKSKAELLYLGIRDAWYPPKFDATSFIERMHAKALKWASSRPSHPVAHFTYVTALKKYAWHYRGSGYGNSVSKDNLKVFRKYNKKALDYLIKHRDKLDSYIQWYEAMITLTGELDWDFEVISKLVEEAEEKFDDTDQIHDSVVFFLLPKWHGNADSLDHFIQRSALKIKVKTADEHYADLYSYAAFFYYERKLFRDTRVDWERMRRGLETINFKYPTKWNKNKFAYYACIAGDKPTTRLLLAEIGSTPIGQLWKPKARETFDACVKWATEPDPSIELLATIEKP